jgi:hypothetical protein
MLALAAFRVYRLIARDTITEPFRAAATYPDRGAVALADDPADEGLAVVGDAELPKSWRVYISTLIRCPWCAGFYVSAGWWLLWQAWPHWTMAMSAPWAISAVVALLAKNLDA